MHCFESVFHLICTRTDFLVLQEYWVLRESRISLQPMLGGVSIVALSISSHEQTQ